MVHRYYGNNAKDRGKTYYGSLYFSKKLPNGEIQSKIRVVSSKDLDYLSHETLSGTVFAFKAPNIKSARMKYLERLPYHRELLGESKRIRVRINGKEILV
jgi:hypothetical protein